MNVRVKDVQLPCYLAPYPHAKIKNVLAEFEQNVDFFLCHKKKDEYVPVSDAKSPKVVICSDSLMARLGMQNSTDKLIDAVGVELDILDGKRDLDMAFIDAQAERLRWYMLEINLVSEPHLLVGINMFMGLEGRAKFDQLVRVDQGFMQHVSQMYPETAGYYRRALH
jgi:hypothetical protein